MSNFDSERDKLTAHLEELKRKHRELDTYIQETFQNRNITDEVRRLKTEKLWIKDEIHRIENALGGSIVNGY